MKMIAAGVRARYTDFNAKGARGQVLVLVALMLGILIASVALTADYGIWLNSRRSYQNAVDAAVLAGGAQLQRPTTPAERQLARQEAWGTLERELELDPTAIDEVAWSASNTPAAAPHLITMPDGYDYQLWVSTPPIDAGSRYSGAYTAADSRTIFARVTRQRPLFFGRIITSSAPEVSAWATAGLHPNRFAVITLRKNGQPTNGNPTDLDVNGGTVLRVLDGDLGGNWGLSVNGVGSQVLLEPDDAAIYLVEPTSGQTGGNNWTTSQVVNSSGTYVPPQPYAEVPDPNYPAPCVTYGVAPGTCLMDRGNVNITAGSPSVRVGDDCPVATAVKLASGRYNNITIRNGKCAILDPAFDPVAGKNNGVYYITGTLDLNNGALLVGEGVTVVFDSGANLDMNAGATLSLNDDPAGCSGQNCKFAGWTVNGRLNWTSGVSPTYTVPTDPNDRGLAIYVMKDTSPATDILQMSSGSGIDFKGIIYAPWDNVKLSGQPSHNDLGQTVTWTLMLTGGVEFEQIYDGPVDERPRLLEPTIGQ